MTDTRVGPLHRFADFVREERTRLTERWMNAVVGDADLVEADKLTYQQLVDHLPEILEELCTVLDVEDFGFCRDKVILMSRPEMTRTAHITIE